MNLEFQQD